MSSEENQFNVQGYNIVTMLKRLEAATSRLEDISIFQSDNNRSDGQSMRSVGQGQGAAAAGQSQEKNEAKAVEDGEQEETVPKSVVEFKHFIEKSVIPFVKSSQAIDDLVGGAAETFEQAFQAQLQFLSIVAKSKKPEMSDPAFMEVLKPINEKIEQINQVKDSNRGSQFYNHLCTICEGAPVLGWVVGDTPMSLIPEFKDSSHFWSNRVMKEYKEKDQRHVTWVSQFLNIFEALKVYVKEFHTTGPSWNNANGKPLGDVLAGAKSVDAPSGGAAPPPPPPPPPAGIFDADNSQNAQSSAPAGGMNAVFADLNRGENITSGLKKVEKSEMTHKNPSLRQAAPPVSKKPTPPKKPSSLSSSLNLAEPKKKPAKMELVDGTKWIIENFTEADVPSQQPLVVEAEMQQSVFIGNCSGITVQVKGKANAISVSETTKTGVVVDSLISGIDFIKSFKFGLQVVGTVAMISVDKSDEGSIYLSQQSIDADVQIYTSCATSLNVNVLKNEDFEELAIPEQFKHSVRNGRLVSEVVEHAG